MKQYLILLSELVSASLIYISEDWVSQKLHDLLKAICLATPHLVPGLGRARETELKQVI